MQLHRLIYLSVLCPTVSGLSFVFWSSKSISQIDTQKPPIPVTVQVPVNAPIKDTTIASPALDRMINKAEKIQGQQKTISDISEHISKDAGAIKKLSDKILSSASDSSNHFPFNGDSCKCAHDTLIVIHVITAPVKTPNALRKLGKWVTKIFR